MDCGHECYKIGGPWIDINPRCPVHRPGGLQDQEEEREAQKEALEERVAQLEERVRQLEEKLQVPWDLRGE